MIPKITMLIDKRRKYINDTLIENRNDDTGDNDVNR